MVKMAPNLFLSVAISITSICEILSSTGSTNAMVLLSLISTACLALPVNSLHVGASSSTTTTTTSSEDPDRHDATILREPTIANRNFLYRLHCAVVDANVQLVEDLLQEDAEANKKGVPARYGPENALARCNILCKAVKNSRWSGDTDSISVTVDNANQSGRASEEIPVTNTVNSSNSIEGPFRFPCGSEENENQVRIVELLLEGGFRPPCEPADLPEDVMEDQNDAVFSAPYWFWFYAAGPDWRRREMDASSQRSTPNLRVLWLLLLYGAAPIVAYAKKLDSVPVYRRFRRPPIRSEVLQALEKIEGPTVGLQLQVFPSAAGPSTPTTSTSTSSNSNTRSVLLILSSAVFSLVTAGGGVLAEFSATDPRSLAEIGQPLAQNIVRERYRAPFESGRAQQILSKVRLQVTVGDRVLDAQDVSQQFARLVLNRLDLVVRVNNSSAGPESDFSLELKSPPRRRLGRSLMNHIARSASRAFGRAATLLRPA